jgi:hypothetical protein
VIKAIKSFFQSGSLLFELNATAIALLPNPELLKDFPPLLRFSLSTESKATSLNLNERKRAKHSMIRSLIASNPTESDHRRHRRHQFGNAGGSEDYEVSLSPHPQEKNEDLRGARSISSPVPTNSQGRC